MAKLKVSTSFATAGFCFPFSFPSIDPLARDKSQPKPILSPKSRFIFHVFSFNAFIIF